MNKVCAFFGHSMFVKCRLDFNKLKKIIKDLILSNFSTFLVGTHGEFDEMCLKACLELKEIFPNIKILKVYANISSLTKVDNIDRKFEIVSYLVEDLYFKRRITQTNKYMVDDADIIVCYVDKTISKSGALSAVKYALKQNKTIVNLFEY